MFGQLVNETTLPVRKRRRPALSCIECRRRKIKCDRNLPCNHCKQTKNSMCVYKDLHAINPNRRASPPSHATPPIRHVTENSQVAIVPGLPNEFHHQLPSPHSSPQTALGLDWSSEKGSNPPTENTAVDDTQSPNDDPGLVDRERRLKQALPDGMNATVDEIKGVRWQKALGLSFSTFNDVIVEDGTQGAKIRTKFFNQSDQTPIKELRGSVSKTRFFGQTHWMNSFEQFHRICSFKDSFDRYYGSDDPSIEEANAEVRRLIEKCKTMARKIKAERSVKWHMNPDFKSYMPPRDTSDKLVHHYLRTMESTHRILHIPQFLREYEGYWDNPEKAPIATVVKILLVMAIGSCFHQEADSESIRENAQQWVYSAQSWISAPFDKGRLNLGGLQVQCLLLVSRQTNALGGDLIWIAAGNLVRSAFQIGLHRDPKWFPKMSFLHAELRRRLWATVLEMAVQTSIDTGMPPLITPNDYDTEPPSNFNDEDLLEAFDASPTPKPPHVFTQSSLQIQLLKSLPLRLHVGNMLNDIHTDPTYEQILKVGSEVSKACKEATLLIQSYPAHLSHPTALQCYLFDLFLRRFLLTIHLPFSVKSQADPRYYFSRKVCVDTAMIIMSRWGREMPISPPVLDASGNEIMDDYSRLCVVGGGFYKDIITHAGLLVCLELISQLEEEAALGLPPSPSNATARQPYKKAVDDLLVLFTKRIELGENNVKGLLFLTAAKGQVDALEQGEDLEKGIVLAARIGAKKCVELLRNRMPSPLTSLAEDETGANGNGGSWQSDILYEGTDYEYDFAMQDGNMSNFNFDIPDSWLFAGWGDNGEL